MIRIDRGDCPYPKALNDNNYKHPRNKDSLRESAHDKCMYCESKISHIDFAHVEHIKPKDDDKYPELTYVWENLGYSCPKCNNAKSNKYFVDTPFVNPYNEDPSEFLFAFGAFLFSKDGNERGEITIREVELNRPGLVEKRAQRISEVNKSLSACNRTSSEVLKLAALEELKKESDTNKEYSMVIRSFLESNQT